MNDKKFHTHVTTILMFHLSHPIINKMNHELYVKPSTRYVARRLCPKDINHMSDALPN